MYLSVLLVLCYWLAAATMLGVLVGKFLALGSRDSDRVKFERLFVPPMDQEPVFHRISHVSPALSHDNTLS